MIKANAYERPWAMDLSGKKILLIKLRYIGDTLSILPIVSNLKEKVPDIVLDVMVNKGTEEVLAHQSGIRRVLAYDRYKAKKNIISSIKYHINIIKYLRYEKYDLIIDFTHGDRAAFLAFVTGAPVRITYQNASKISHLLMNRVVHADPEGMHIVDFQLESLRLIGLDGFDRQPRLRVPDSLQKKTDQRVKDLISSSESPIVAIHPGARGRLRQWSPVRYAEIARRLKETYQAHVILLGGPGEGELVEDVASHMGFSPLFKTTGLGLLEVGAWLRRCHLFIGNDSAPGHISASVGCPSITLFGPTFPHMWRPVGPENRILFKNVPCCGCRQETCIRPDNSCMDLIGVQEVWRDVEELLPIALQLKDLSVLSG
jgi:lipopolysaccharide heptosyltransferase II